MAELYLLNEGAALLVGTVLNQTEADEFRELVRGRATLYLPNTGSTGTAHATVNALHSAGAPAWWAMALDDGTAPPTVTAGAFVFPTTRTFIPVQARVHSIGTRQTLAGQEIALTLNPENLSFRPVSYKL